MLSITHKGGGTLDLPQGGVEVSYLLTVTRTGAVEEGYGYVQSKQADFARLLKAGEPLGLHIETGGAVKIVITAAAGERAVFAVAGAIPGSLFVDS